MRPHGSIFVFSPVIWGLVILQTSAIALWIAFSPRISLSFHDFGSMVVMVGFFLCIGMAVAGLRELRPSLVYLERVQVAAMGMVFMIVAFHGIRFLNHLTMSMALPLADDWLDSWDKLIGFDWYAYATWLGQFQEWLPYARVPYSTTPLASGLVFMMLVLIGRAKRAVEFGSLLFIAALFTIIVAGFFPAEAAMVRYMDEAQRAVFGAGAGDYHMAVFNHLRGSDHIVMSFANLPGLATFPSFHTITGLFIVYACRDSLYTLVPAGLWTSVMLIVTPVYGGHYLIDILAGGAVTAVLIFCALHVSSRRGARLHIAAGLPTGAIS